MRCSTALLLALSACICLTHLTAVQALYAATCEDLECTFTVGRVRYTTNEFGGRLGLLNMDGSVMVNSTVFGVGFSYLTERTRGVLIDVGLQNCYFDVGDPLTEAAPTGHDRTFGDLINNFHLPSLPTTVQNLPNHPYPGVTTVEYTYWAEGRPLFIQTFSVSDRDFVVHLSNDTRFTLGIPPTATYKAGGLKIGAFIPEMNWKAPDSGAYSNSSYLILWGNVTYAYAEGDMVTLSQGNDTVREVSMRTVNTERGYEIYYSLENFFLIDGIPYSGNTRGNEPDFTVEGWLFPQPYLQNLAICKNATLINNTMQGHWESLFYDPSLSVLFTNGPPASSKSAERNRKSVNIVVAVVVPLVILAVIAAVLIVLFVPPVYKTILPSDPFQRNHHKALVQAGEHDRMDAPTPTVASAGAAAAAAPASASAAPRTTAEAAPRSTWTAVRKPAE